MEEKFWACMFLWDCMHPNTEYPFPPRTLRPSLRIITLTPKTSGEFLGPSNGSKAGNDLEDLGMRDVLRRPPSTTTTTTLHNWSPSGHFPCTQEILAISLRG
jgi:hypothetical protein